MQKKILACLLVTPVATAAVANTTVSDFNPNEASTDATQEGFKLDFGATGDGLYAPVGIYTVKFKEINLYPGTYELNLGKAKNILVKVDGANVTVGADGIAEFEIKETKDVEITLNADNCEIAFECTKAELTVIVDEKGLNEKFTEALDEAKPVELISLDAATDALKNDNYKNKEAAYKTLKTEYDALIAEYNRISNNIAKVDEPLDLKNVYGEFKLWLAKKGESVIDTDIASLKEKVEAYNTAAESLNNDVKGINEMMDYYNRVQNLVNAYESKLTKDDNNSDANYKGVEDKFIEARIADELKIVEDKIAQIRAKLDKEYAAGTLKDPQKDKEDGFKYPDGCERDEILSDIANIATAYNTAVADKAAYEKYVAEMKKFTETYNGVLNALNIPADVDGKEGDAFLTTRRNATAEATKIYGGLYVADLAEKLTAADAANEDINEAALNAKISALTAAATEMTTVKTNFEALAKAENDAYGTYETTLGSKQPVSGLLGSYEEAKATKVPAGQDAKYKELTKAVDDAFDALEKFVTDHYGTDLSTTDNQTEYNRLVTDVEDAISKLKTDTGNYDKWNKLATDLDTNISEIEERSEALRTYVESKDKGVTIDLSSKFEKTIINIQASINQLKNGDDTSEIEKAIDTMLETAKNIDNAFRKAFDAYIGFKGDLAAYKTFIGDKLILKDKDGKEVYGRTNAQTQYDNLAKVVDTYQAKLNEVAKANNQEIIQKAGELAVDIEGSTFEAELDKAKKAFAYNASLANKNYAQGVYDATEANYNRLYNNGNGVPGIAAANLNALTTEKDNAVAKVTEDASPDLTDADTALKTLVENCTKFDNNVNAYARLWDIVKNVSEGINEALKFEEDCYTIDPAKAHFTEVLNGYKADYDKFMADIKTALEGKTVYDKEDALKARANELTGNVDNVKKRIHDNQQFYDALLDESKIASAAINNGRNFLDTNYDKESEAYKSYMKQLDDLADELTALNLAMTGDFGEGELNEPNAEEYTIKYEDIASRANQLLSDIDNAVCGLNNAWIDKWEDVIKGARSVKDAAVRVYNAYYWDIDNEGYHKFVEDVLAEYRDLYDYTKKISDLDAKFRAWVQKQNDDRVVFSQNDYNEWTAKINGDNGVNAEIANREEALVNAMNTKGREYWTKEYINRASLVYDEMKGALLLADMATEKDGVVTLSADLVGTSTGKVFEDAIAAMPKAIADKEKAGNADPAVEKYALQIGFAMDAIADELDKIDYTADQLEAAAKVHLATLYNDFTHYAAEAKSEAGKADFVTKERIKKAIDDIEAQETAAAEDYKGIENAFDALRYTQADPFKDFADAIKNILDKLNEESEANEASKKLYDYYTLDDGDGIIPTLNEDLDALKAYAASMAAYSKTTDAIAAAETAVNELATFVDANQAILSEDECKTWAETLNGKADKAIEDGYAAVRTAETGILAGLIKDVRVAFDNAKAMSEPAWDQKLAAVYEAKINAAMAEYAALDGKTDEDFQTAALKLENDLCTCLSGLEEVYSHDGTSAANARAELDKAYNPVKGNIETSDDMAGFEEEVQTEYADKYKDLSDKLDDIKKRYDSDDAVVVREANYLAEIKAVQAALDALNAEAAQADQEAKYNIDVANNASALAAEIVGYQARYDALLAYTQQHKLYDEGNSDNYYWNQLDLIAWYIASDTQWLADSQKKDAAQPLTPESVLPNGSAVNTNLNYVDFNAHRDVYSNAYNGATTALQNASGALADAHLVPADRTKLQNDYDAANLNYYKTIQDFENTLNEYFPTGYMDWEKLGEYVKAVDTAEQAFNDVVAASQAIIDAIGELHFVPGDVEADPDHEVTAVDVQQVIAWIGEDMTFDDLVASSPRQAYAADVNGDSKINIADVVAISNIILNDLNNPSQAPRLLVKGVQTAAENNLTVALGETVDGVREYAVMINNTTAFVGGQLDINVGAGMEIVDIELTERGADHKLYRFDNNSGARVVIASMANDELRGNSGAMLIVRTRGAGKLTVGNAVFADINATAYGLAGEGMSAIDSIGESFRNAKERIYNVAGQALDRIQRGVNIIRKSDGTTTKEMH